MFGLLDVHFILIISAFIISVEGDLSRTPNGAYFCNTAIYRTCENGFSIRYPFHHRIGGGDDLGHCGYPGFGVNCSDNNAEGRPIINISNNLYYILGTDSESQTLRVVRKDVDDEECPRPTKNFTLDATSPLSFFSSVNDNIIYFYNCSGYPKDVVQHLPCLDTYYNNTMRSFAFDEYDIPNGGGYNRYTNCQQTVRVPVANIGNESDYKRRLKLGFDLYWHTPNECLNCEESGGNCFYNNTITGAPPLCSCPEDQRMYHGSCPKKAFIEYEALFYGLKLALRQNALSVAAQTDSTNVTSFFKSGKVPWPIGRLHRDIRAHSRLLQSFNLEHVYRESNALADRIASCAPSHAYVEITPSSFSEDVRKIVFEDYTRKKRLRM